MSQFHLTLLFCLVAAFFVDSNAEDDDRDALAEIHAELASQLLEEQHSTLRGKQLASKLHEGRRDLNEMEREIVQQLLEEEFASLSGQELARMLGKDPTESLQTRSLVGCDVEGLGVSCCIGKTFKIFFKKYELKACADLKYSPEEGILAVAITAFGKPLYKKTLPVGNADGLCVRVPNLGSISICLKVSDVSVSGGRFHGCLALTPKAFGFKTPSIKLGCINLP